MSSPGGGTLSIEVQPDTARDSLSYAFPSLKAAFIHCADV